MGGEPWSKTLKRWARLVGTIDAALVLMALVMAALLGSWSLAGVGTAIWCVALVIATVWAIAIVSRGGLLPFSISERSGVMMPGEMARLLRPERWLEVREQLTLAAMTLVPLSFLAWAIWAVG